MTMATTAVDRSRVLVVDSQPHAAHQLTTMLMDHGYVVRAAAEGQSALESFTAWCPDLLITDLALRRLHGLELCRRIRAQSNVPIIVLSATSEDEIKIEALDAGADDYVTRPFGHGELLARVRATLRRSRGESPAGSFDTGDFRVDIDARRVHVSGREVRLTPREFELFTFMARHPNRVLDHRRVLQAVWGRGSQQQPQYLHVFVGQLRKKLEPDPANPRYLVTEPWVGYKFMSEGLPR